MLSVLVACFLISVDAPRPEAAPDAVVIAPREFVTALQPLVEHRQRQGHRLAYLANSGSAAEIRAAIRKAAGGGALKYVLIVGDADPAARVNPAISARSVPTPLVPAAVNVKWGSEAQIASDNWYVDLDSDHLPDLAVGRIPADSAADVSRVVAKILAFERNRD